MARRSNTGFTGISFRMENQAASATLFQFSTHAFVYSTPSAVNPGGRQNKSHDDCRNVACDNGQKDCADELKEALCPMLEDQKNHCENKNRQKQVFHRAENPSHYCRRRRN